MKRIDTMKHLCKIADCEKKHEAKGLCSFHYHRKMEGIPLEVKNIRGSWRRGARRQGRSKLPDDLKDAYGIDEKGGYEAH